MAANGRHTHINYADQVSRAFSTLALTVTANMFLKEKGNTKGERAVSPTRRAAAAMQKHQMCGCVRVHMHVDSYWQCGRLTNIKTYMLWSQIISLHKQAVRCFIKYEICITRLVEFAVTCWPKGVGGNGAAVG